MEVLGRFLAGHADLVHDVAFDYYGSRLATCSSDHSFRVWDKAEDGTWTNTATIKVRTLPPPPAPKHRWQGSDTSVESTHVCTTLLS